MKIGILQLDTVWGDPTANFNKIESALRKSSEIPDILLLPEMFDHGYILDPGTVKNLDPEESLAQVRNLAEKYQLAIAGTIPNNRDGNYYNTFIFVEEDGVFATYDKIHLFSPAGEAEAYAEGDEIVEILYQDAVIRPLICYDLRFPYCSWNDTNYDILMYSANWPETRIHHWEALLRARAIENQCYVIGSNRIGKDENGLQYNGQSKIYDYQGNTILNAENSDVLKVVEIDLSAQQAYRKKFPFLQDQK